jgi:hypothetical protein
MTKAKCLGVVGVLALAAGTAVAGANTPRLGDYIVIGYNDLGMHCMNEDFSEFMVLPPFNTLHAVVVDRSGEKPAIVTNGIEVRYSVNTPSPWHSTNFWKYTEPIFGFRLPHGLGLTGNALSGTMEKGAIDWLATGIPVAPGKRGGRMACFQLADITVRSTGKGRTVLARTRAVTPVSWEIRCDFCHFSPGTTTAMNILQAHDRRHLAMMQQMHPGMPPLTQQTPVACGTCHRQPELEPLVVSDDPTNPTLSAAMHRAHAARLPGYLPNLRNACYACHPGIETECLRDIHAAAGMTCSDCHGGMMNVADPARAPWADLPRCSTCHPRPGRPDRAAYNFEQPNTLYRNSVGHGGLPCVACHNSPHAILPTNVPNDNAQAIAVQGHAGTICDCRVCHQTTPASPFVHAAPGN